MRKIALSIIMFLAVTNAASAADDYVITLKDHVFSPPNLEIPANKKILLKVKNLQTSPAEFESSDLDREKVVAANSEITVIINPQSSGTYKYFDDFHRDTTGVITVK